MVSAPQPAAARSLLTRARTADSASPLTVPEPEPPEPPEPPDPPPVVVEGLRVGSAARVDAGLAGVLLSAVSGFGGAADSEAVASGVPDGLGLAVAVASVVGVGCVEGGAL
ncbi:hypothetical protein ACFVFI_32845, partial [Streptomyces sp. NPDC057705]